MLDGVLEGIVLVTNDKSQSSPSAGGVQQVKPQDPQWAAGLRQLYDSVVDEPLPDSFKDLLSKLDGGTK